jgi:hypothetical protein
MTVHVSPDLAAQLAAIWNGWWWLILLVALSVPGKLAERAAVRHHRRVELEQARAARPVIIEREHIVEREVRPPAPEGCQHRKVTDVRVDGKLVAWVCLNPECGEQLPANYDFQE